MGPSWITRCWSAFAVGVFPVALGDAAIWGRQLGYLPWSWSALEWYIWLRAVRPSHLHRRINWKPPAGKRDVWVTH